MCKEKIWACASFSAGFREFGARARERCDQDLGLPSTSPLHLPGIMIVAGDQAMTPGPVVDLQEVD